MKVEGSLPLLREWAHQAGGLDLLVAKSEGACAHREAVENDGDLYDERRTRVVVHEQGLSPMSIHVGQEF